MALLQISEPGLSAAPHQRRLAVGIDLGTTNSLVATVRSGQAETLADEQGRHLLPSVVHYQQQGHAVGYDARANAARDPANTISSVKRMMGRSLADIQTRYPHLPYQLQASENGLPMIATAAGLLNPIRVSADILKALAERATATLGGDLDGVVITVPAYFDDAQRQGTKDAARLAGLHVLRLLNEPTAAAIAYGLDSGQEGVIAVYDLGGGTFDISILRLRRGVFEVLATGGDSALALYDQLSAIAPTLIINYDDKSWQALLTQLGAITGHEKQAAERIAAFDKQLAQVKQQMTLPPQPVNAIVYTAAAHSANLWTAESAQGKLLHQLGFTLADLPAGLQTSTSQGKRHDIIQLGGENLATGLNGEGLFVFAGDEKDVAAIYANPLLAHLPSVKNKRVWALGTETFRLDYYSAMLVLQRLNAMFK